MVSLLVGGDGVEPSGSRNSTDLQSVPAPYRSTHPLIHFFGFLGFLHLPMAWSSRCPPPQRHILARSAFRKAMSRQIDGRHADNMDIGSAGGIIVPESGR